MTLRPLIFVLALAATGHAQVAATDRPDPHEPRHGNPGLGVNVALALPGDFHEMGGWLARFEYEMLAFYAPDGTIGPVVGMTGGFEYWRDAPDQGIAMPVGLVIGVRVLPIRATIGLGVHAINVDEVDDDTGVGLYAPYAGASLGLDIRGVRVFADTRISRHWQLGADDFTQWQLGLSVGYTMGPAQMRR